MHNKKTIAVQNYNNQDEHFYFVIVTADRQSSSLYNWPVDNTSLEMMIFLFVNQSLHCVGLLWPRHNKVSLLLKMKNIDGAKDCNIAECEIGIGDGQICS